MSESSSLEYAVEKGHISNAEYEAQESCPNCGDPDDAHEGDFDEEGLQECYQCGEKCEPF